MMSNIVLPLEIFLQIIDGIDRWTDEAVRRRTLGSLRSTSQQFEAIVTPLLFRDIQIYHGKERSIQQMLGLSDSGLTMYIETVRVDMLSVVPKRLLAREGDKLVTKHIDKKPFKYPAGDIGYFAQANSSDLCAQSLLLSSHKLNMAFLAFFGAIAEGNSRFQDLFLDSRYRLLDSAEHAVIHNFAFHLIIWQSLVYSQIKIETLNLVSNHLYPLRADDVSESINVSNLVLDIQKSNPFHFQIAISADGSNWLHGLFGRAPNKPPECIELSIQGRFHSTLTLLRNEWPGAAERLKGLTLHRSNTRVEFLASSVNNYRSLEYLKVHDCTLQEDENNGLKTWKFVFDTISIALGCNSMVDFDFVNLGYTANSVIVLSDKSARRDKADAMHLSRLKSLAMDMEAYRSLVVQLNRKRASFGLPRMKKQQVFIGYRRY